jgi:sialate O-acetylesterase
MIPQNNWLGRYSIVLAGAFLALSPLYAEVKLPTFFADHMVLQRDMPVPVWGTAIPGESVTVTAGTGSATAQTGQDGTWIVRLAPMKASATPMELKVAGSNAITVHDVLVGDVWVCAGQSNMAVPMTEASTFKEEQPQADHPQLRGLFIPKTMALEPQSGSPSSWKLCSPETLKSFSAVAYYFGKEILEREKVPVGLIHSNLGATPAQAWTSLEALEADPELKKTYAERFRQVASNLDAVKAAHDQWLAQGGADYLDALAKYRIAAWQAQQKGEPAPAKPQPPATPEPQRTDDATLPSVLYNGMIAPLEPYAIKGVIWYQGESNAGQTALYRKLFPALIADWRKHWGQGDFPFLFVQLPNYGTREAQPIATDGGWAALREAQMLTLKAAPNTAMAIAIDLGDGQKLHPPYKAEVGHRLALAARKAAYGETVLASGPLYATHEIAGDKVRITFTEAGQGLKIGRSPVVIPGAAPAQTGELKGFAIAGADKKFVWAKAKIESPGKVVVWSEEVTAPTAVRYGWGADPEVNLYNSADLPASPFRTDSPTGFGADR